MRDDFAVFIVSHGRADRVVTVPTLDICGYTGKWYIVIDDEDEQENEYRKRYGDKVIQFSKKAYDGKFDIMDLHNDRRVVVYARNAVFDIARSLGIRYFLVLDDDYKDIEHRYIENGKLYGRKVSHFDVLCDAMVEFLQVSGACSIAFAQGGDFIGGADSGNLEKGLLRKVMNTWFCDTEKQFEIIGRLNEDTNTYTYLGTQGKLFFTVTSVMITQEQTQANDGGLSDIYRDVGTFVKSFYSVMCAPSCVRVAAMGDTSYRVHHEVKWNNCTPKILSDKWRKA